MATFTHEELILLATNKYNLLVQSGEWGAKSLEEECNIAMQAELMALKKQSVQLAKRKMVTRRTMIKGGINRAARKRIRKTLQTNVSSRKMRSGNAYLPRTVNLMRRSTTIAPTIGASTIRVGAITRKRNISKVRNT